MALHPICIPVIDKVYPLEQTAEAIQYLGDGEVQGKVVVG
jgi:NADPH:quinone reductase-like Zn-dependent oxidoreductase